MSKHVSVAAHEPLQPVRQGTWKRELIGGPRVSVIEWSMDVGVETRPHGHGEDQYAYHVSGKFELILAGETTMVVPGDAYPILAGASHALRCIEKGSFVLMTLLGVEEHGHGHDGHGDGHAH